jgi:hypothetical protein
MGTLLAIVVHQTKVMPKWLHPITLFSLLCAKADCGTNVSLLAPQDIDGYDPLAAEIVGKLQALKPDEVLSCNHELRLRIELILDHMVRQL